MDRIKGNKWTQFAGVKNMANRLRVQGGSVQQDRMIDAKRWSLDHALQYSYQAAKVKRINENTVMSALINPNKLKQDYDDKIISIGFEHGFKPGDVFEWANTGTKWLIYLQDLTELAYFRGDIRKCSYEVQWKDENGEVQSTHLAIRGPVETKINYIQKHGISVNTPNYSLSILMPQNEYTKKYFTRYGKFYLQGNDTCWRVEAIDSISSPGILEVIAVEYYVNETEDDVENGIVGGLIEEIKDPNGDIPMEIVGSSFIKVKKPYEFSFDGTLAATWFVDKKYPVSLEIDPDDARKVTITWNSSYSG